MLLKFIVTLITLQHVMFFLIKNIVILVNVELNQLSYCYGSNRN